MTSTENVHGADNQQERLIKIGWIIGFVEGEGCFSVAFVKQPDRKKRRGYTTGIQVWCEFAVTQGESSLAALKEIKEFFGVGNIYLNKRYDNHREHLYRYAVRKQEDLQKVIIPFFNSYPMRTIKGEQFKRFRYIAEQMALKKHLTPEGIIEIAQIAEQMNARKSRGELIRILREHTSRPD